MGDPIEAFLADEDAVARYLRGLPSRLDAGEGDPARALAQLVLSLVDLLRQVMERQAVRRVDAGSLTDEQIDRLGATFLALEQRMAELREQFDLSEDDLRLDLPFTDVDRDG